MAKELPYVLVPGKIADLFRKIADAKVPDSFTQAYLSDTLGFKGKNDRSLIALLKSLGFLNASGNPTPRYRELKNNTSKPEAIGAGIREAYSPIFDSNENAHTLKAEDLKGLVGQISGADRDMASRISSTLLSLIKEASFGGGVKSEPVKAQDQSDSDEADEDLIDADTVAVKNSLRMRNISSSGLNSEFHFNIQVHLPNNGSEETYLNIFNAIREAFR